MLTVSIQAGGQSTRMGEDKALKPFLGHPLIERVIERLRPIADEIIVTTNHPEDYGFLVTDSETSRLRAKSGDFAVRGDNLCVHTNHRGLSKKATSAGKKTLRRPPNMAVAAMC